MKTRQQGRVATLATETQRRRGVGWATFSLLLIWALVACAGQPEPAKAFKIGILTTGGPYLEAVNGFREGLKQAGYEEGHNITYLVRDTQGNSQALNTGATEIVQQQVDLIFTVASPATQAAIAATKSTQIPVIFTVVADPVGSGFVKSLIVQETNVTGVTNQSVELTGKRLEFLLQVAPRVRRVGVLSIPTGLTSGPAMVQLNQAAAKLGVTLIERQVASSADVPAALAQFTRDMIDALYLLPDAFLVTQGTAFVERSLALGIPLVVHEEGLVKQGALVGYGADFNSLGSQAARLAVKVLRGQKASELPIEVPQRLVLTLNLKTAQQIGQPIAQEVLFLADRIIQ